MQILLRFLTEAYRKRIDEKFSRSRPVTRLRTTDIRDIPFKLKDYDLELRKKTGITLRQIACRAVGRDEGKSVRDLDLCPIGVIPITSGRGEIEGFVEAVAAVARHLGFTAFVTDQADVSGLREALQKGARMILLADDDCFVAIHLPSRRAVDNANATGRGFAIALESMVGGLQGKEILLIGAGRVGRSAAWAIIKKGALLSVYDRDRGKSEALAKEGHRLLSAKVRVEPTLDKALLRHRILFDACPAKGFILATHITPETYLVAPGIPSGLTARARAKLADRYLEDPLRIGVAIMTLEALYGSQEEVLP